MNKNEALYELVNKKKISHIFFSPTEYIYQLGHYIYDENGMVLNNFWEERIDEKWETGWSIFEELIIECYECGNCGCNHADFHYQCPTCDKYDFIKPVYL